MAVILVGGHPHWTAELQGGRQNKPQEHHGCVKYHCALWEDGHPCSMARRRFNKGENGNVIAGAADNDNKQRDVGILPDGYVHTNPFPLIPYKQGTLISYFEIPMVIHTLHSFIGPALSKVRTPWLSCH